MTNEQVAALVLASTKVGDPIHAVLINRGGWINAHLIDMAWHSITELWSVRLFAEGGALLRTVYIEAENILGISIERRAHRDLQQDQQGPREEDDRRARQEPGPSA